MAMEKHQEKSHQESIAEIDAKVETMKNRLLGEGYKFELEITKDVGEKSVPHKPGEEAREGEKESVIVLRAGGREFNFTKKEKYDIKAADGSYGTQDIDKRIEERIREFGK